MTVAAGGGFGGKPRPALVLQADVFEPLTTVIVALFTSELTDAMPVRPRFVPDALNNLREVSDLMADIVITVRRSETGKVIGHLTGADLRRAENSVFAMLGFG